MALKSVLLFLVGSYVLLVALAYFGQRHLLYFPDRTRTSPAEARFPEAAEETLTTVDGERVIVWHVPPAEGRPVFLYFHGNGGALVNRVQRFRGLTAGGNGLVALSYRDYGGASGTPSQQVLIAYAEAAYACAAAGYAAERLIAFGESLGTGIAIAFADDKPVDRVILQ